MHLALTIFDRKIVTVFGDSGDAAVYDLCSIKLGLSAHLLKQFRPADAVWKARMIMRHRYPPRAALPRIDDKDIQMEAR